MLKKLLAKLTSGDTLRVSDLSREMEVNSGLMLQMLGDLERMGYIQRPVQAGDSCCSHCSGGCAGCAEGQPEYGISWMLTEKGKRYVAGARDGAAPVEGGGTMPQLTLDELKPGQQGVVVKIGGQGPIRRRILDMGLTTGTKVTVVRRAPLGDPIEFLVRGYSLSLRHNEARGVQVKLAQEG